MLPKRMLRLRGRFWNHDRWMKVAVDHVPFQQDITERFGSVGMLGRVARRLPATEAAGNRSNGRAHLFLIRSDATGNAERFTLSEHLHVSQTRVGTSAQPRTVPRTASAPSSAACSGKEHNNCECEPFFQQVGPGEELFRLLERRL